MNANVRFVPPECHERVYRDEQFNRLLTKAWPFVRAAISRAA